MKTLAIVCAVLGLLASGIYATTSWGKPHIPPRLEAPYSIPQAGYHKVCYCQWVRDY